MTQQLYTPLDLAKAIKKWGANCGPAALAAVVGCPLSIIRDWFPSFVAKGYVNPTQMTAAIAASGRRAVLTAWSPETWGRKSPKHGVAFLQFKSPSIDALPVRVQYQHTHWIATHGLAGRLYPEMVFDINAGEWIPPRDWELEWWPKFAEAHQATHFSIRTAYEVIR